MVRFIIIFNIIFTFGNCMDAVGYKEVSEETEPDKNKTLLTYGVAYALLNPRVSVTLEIEHSSATGSNSFYAYLYDMSGKRVAGIASQLTADKTYKGTFKNVVSGGSVTGTDAGLAPGDYRVFVYVDSDGDGKLGYATYYNINLTVPEKAYAGGISIQANSENTIRLIDSSFTNAKDIVIQYSNADLNLDSSNPVVCYWFFPGIVGGINSAKALDEARRYHAVSMALGSISNGSFYASINFSVYFFGQSWVNAQYYRFLPSNTVMDVICHIDSFRLDNVYGVPNLGEAFFRALGVSTSDSYTKVEKIDILQN